MLVRTRRLEEPRNRQPRHEHPAENQFWTASGDLLEIPSDPVEVAPSDVLARALDAVCQRAGVSREVRVVLFLKLFRRAPDGSAAAGDPVCQFFRTS